MQARAMVDILAEQTGQSVGMREANYIYISTREAVAQSDVKAATVIHDQELMQAQAEADRKLAKLTGKEYAKTGVIVPFSAEDAVGILQVKAGFEMGLQRTNIHFSNGQILSISAKEFNDFAVWFMTERAGFFAG